MQFRRPCASISSTAVVAVALMAAAAAPASARVAIGAPQAGSTSTGTIPFALKTARGVERAVFRIDGRRVDVDGSRPFRYGARGRLDTRRLRDGRHRLTVSVRMRSGRHVRLRRTIRVVNARAVVAADRLAPSLSWSSPRSGQTVRGLLEGAGCSVDARDKGGVARVEFLLDAVPMGHDTDAPYTCMWDTTASADGVRRVTAIAYDRAGNRTTRSIDVTVANGAAQQPTPTPTAEPTPISTPTPTPTLEPTASPTVTPTPTPTPVPRPVSGVFVSTQGSDATGTGALDRPYRTLGKAAAVAAAGQTVYVRGGTYVGRTTITRTATADAPIAFEPYPGESVVLDGTGVSMTYHESLVTINRSAFVTFEGFEIRNTQGRGLSVLDSTNVTIRGNAVHDTWSHPVMGSGDHLVFEGNRIYRGILANRGGTASNWPGGLSTWAKSDGTRSTDIAFRDNQITETWGEGIIALHADGVTVTGNTVRDVWSVMLYVDNASSVRVERNFLARSSATFDRSGRPAQGIMLANEYYAGLPARPIEDALIDNNVVIGAEHAIAYWHDTRRTTGNTYRGIRVFNNVFKDTRTSTIWLQDVPSTQTQPSGNLARNNIVFRGSDGTTLDIGDLAGWSFSNNAFPDGVPAGSHPASFSGDVQLVDPVAEAGPDGFRLRSTSPAIGAGTSVTEVGADFWGKPRGTRPSVGIHEG